MAAMKKANADVDLGLLARMSIDRLQALHRELFGSSEPSARRLRGPPQEWSVGLPRRFRAEFRTNTYPARTSVWAQAHPFSIR
jgi:hypothetical protein